MDGPQQKRLRDALCDAFDKNDLEELLSFRLEKSLDSIVGPGAFQTVVFKLIERAAREGWLGDLILAACDERPRNLSLQSFRSEQEVLAAKLGHVEVQVGKVEGKLDDLKKLQVQMAYQLDRDLLARRSEAYARLWTRTKATKIYTTQAFGPHEVSDLVNVLSDWYFSECGGLFLTKRAREFYFALQDLVLAIDDFGRWTCKRRPKKPKAVFERLLKTLKLKDSGVRQQARLATVKPESLNDERWRALCGKLSDRLRSLVEDASPEAGEMIYSAVQQVASVLRSNLVHELGSRLGVKRPRHDGAAERVTKRPK